MHPDKIEARLRDVKNVIASQGLEGLEVDAQTCSKLEQVARGELSTEDVLTSIRRRIAAGEFRSPAAQ